MPWPLCREGRRPRRPRTAGPLSLPIYQPGYEYLDRLPGVHALTLRALQQLFPSQDCVAGWKLKVGSQYFPELVVVGLKNAVPMLRGGNSGDGKLRTMEISLETKDWALNVAPAMIPYQEKFSHVEPTGAGVPRIDFWASSALCKWYFSLVMYAVFGNTVSDPVSEFTYD